MARTALDRLRDWAFYAYLATLILFVAFAIAGYVRLERESHARERLTARQCAAIAGAEQLWRVQRRATIAEMNDDTVSVVRARADADKVHAFTLAINKIGQLKCP